MNDLIQDPARIDGPTGPQFACEQDAAGLLERMARLEERERFATHVATKLGDLSRDLDVACIDYVMSDQCVRDLERLRAKDYFLDYPTRILIPRTNSKRKRVLFVFKTGNEHALVRLISYGLRPVCRDLPPTLYSFRPNKTSLDMLRDARTASLAGEHHVLRADISDYGCSIDPELALLPLGRILRNDPELLSFLTWLLMRGKYYEMGTLVEGTTGALPGTAVSNFLMGIYLTDTDTAVAQTPGCSYYGRYGDDVVAFFDTKEHAEQGYSLFKSNVEQLKLNLNADKTQLFEPGDRIELMGFEIERNQIDLSRRSIERVKKRLRRRTREVALQKRQQRLSAEEAGRLIIKEVEHTFWHPETPLHTLSWRRWAFPVVTKTDGLRELDEYAQKCIRYVMTGTWGRGQYRVSYNQLRALGYCPQVSQFYHREKGTL